MTGAGKALGFWMLSVAAAVASLPAASAAEMGTAVAVRPAPLYREPKGGAEILGTYPAGTRMKVFLPVRSGWYVLGFSQPYKGAKYAWIPAWALQVEGAAAAPPTPPQASSGASSEPRGASPSSFGSGRETENWVTAGADVFLMAPSDFQAAVLEVSGTPVITLGFGAEYGRRLGKWISIGLRAGFYSFSQTIASGVAANLVYSASGIWGGPFLGFHFIHGEKVNLALRVGGGLSFNTVGNTSTNEEVSTSPVLGFPIQGKLSFMGNFYQGWGFYAEAGYQLHTLSSAPILAPPAYSSTVLGSSNVTLSALFASVGLSYQF